MIIDAVDANTANIAKSYAQDLMQATVSITVEWAGPLPRLPVRSTPLPTFLFNPGLVTAWFYVTGIMAILMLLTAPGSLPPWP